MASKNAKSPSKGLSLKFLKKIKRQRYASHDAKGGIKEYVPSEVDRLISKKSEKKARQFEKSSIRVRSSSRFIDSEKRRIKRQARIKDIFARRKRSKDIQFLGGKAAFKSFKSGDSGFWVTLSGKRRIFIRSTKSDIPF